MSYNYCCSICGETRDDTAFNDSKKYPFHASDSFLRFTCRRCGEQVLERLHVTWYPGVDGTNGSIRVDVVHMILFEMIHHKECENVVEGLKFFHWRSICDEIERYWNVLWDRDRMLEPQFRNHVLLIRE